MPVNSVFSPSSPQAAAIGHLSWIVFWVSVAIFSLVTAVVLLAVIRFRNDSPGEPVQVFGSRWMEVTWTVGPIAIVAALFGLTITTMQAADPPVHGHPPDLVVVGHQWWWEVRYPAAHVVTANEVHIPVGRRLLVRLDSGDVIHNFWVPPLGPKRDMVPGRPSDIWIEADRAGVYLGACGEYCGTEHAWMRLRVVAEPEAAFQAWQRAQAQVPAQPTTGVAAQGARVFQQRTCASCHAISGTEGQARVAPDLTHVGSRSTLAEVVANTPENLRAWLANPDAIKPGSNMPNLQLTDPELRALVAYLEGLK